MNQQDSFGNMFQRRQINPSYSEVGAPRTTIRSIEPVYPVKRMSFKTAQGGGHEYDWDEHKLKFIPITCLRPTCKVCGVATLEVTKQQEQTCTV